MPAPALFLITPLLETPADLAPLGRALGGMAFASVWLRIGGRDERSRLELAKQAVVLCQEKGAAALVDAPDPRFAARCGADGMHVVYHEDQVDRLSGLRPERILGFGGLRSRDDAMNAGEQADYVMFGEPTADGYVPPLDRVVERCAWWVEIFETPCVGYAPDVAAIKPIAATGVEFVALGPWLLEADPASLQAAAEAIGSGP